MGSLRFWFEVLCYFNGIINDDYFDKNGKPTETLNYKEFIEKLEKKLKNNEEYDIEKLTDETLSKLKKPISIPSRIFGCTGWKGKIRIKKISYEKSKKLEKNSMNFKYPLNKMNNPKDSKFWIYKSLFNGKKEIFVFENVDAKIEVETYWFEKYLKKFFEFYNDKIILAGGKNSFGFGFVKLNATNIKYENTDKSDKTKKKETDFLISKKIELKDIQLETDENILGFNFKYYLRLNEHKKYRKRNFGKQGVSSNFYVSNLLDDNSIVLIGINNPFNPIFKNGELFNAFKDYENWILNIKRGKNE
jgi:CRISPR-associated protein Cmr1